MLVKVEITTAWLEELGWSDADIAFVLDIEHGTDVPDSPTARCPQCGQEPVERKIRFFKYDSAAAAAESIPGRAFVKCICGTWYSYAVVDKMSAHTPVGQERIPAASAASPELIPGTGTLTITGEVVVLDEKLSVKAFQEDAFQHDAFQTD